jgi:hypothetical protein
MAKLPELLRKAPQSGFIRQEDIPLNVFLENRFGKIYTKPKTSIPHRPR